MRPILIGSEIYRRSSYGPRHPLSIPRVAIAIDLARAMGWVEEGAWRDSPRASLAELARFHDPGYLQALIDAERDQGLDAARRERYNIGRAENPIFPEIFSRPATAAGGSLLGARLIAGGGTVFSPAGGTHHGRPDRASGFCYLNDPVLAIDALLGRGLSRIFYVDVDAHHGDGVEDAFLDEERVLTLSVHEEGRWPYTGLGTGGRGGLARNIPVPAGFNDSEMAAVVAGAIIPLGRAFAPDAVVLQCGADALADDPLSRLALSNRALWGVVQAVMGMAPRLLVLGGGGYNPWAVGRCWAGVWATLNGIDPARLPTDAALRLLEGITWSRAAGRNPPRRWLATIADLPAPGPVRAAVLEAVARAIEPLGVSPPSPNPSPQGRGEQNQPLVTPLP